MATLRHYRLDPSESEVAYHVRTKVFLSFDEDIVGRCRPTAGNISIDGSGAQGWLVIPAEGFNSAIKNRDRHIAEILEVAHFPELRFDLDSLLGFDEAKKAGRILGKGRLTVRGRRVPMSISGVYQLITPGTLRIEGVVRTRFSAFGLEPPTLGFVVKRAPDDLQLTARILGKTN